MPDSPPDYYNRLLEQRRAEYASKGLAKMPPEFLLGATQYLASLRELLEREMRENPTSKKVELTRSTYQRALGSARDVLESRVTKIAHQAAQHVNLGGEPANLLPEERALYDALIRELLAFRRTSAPFLETGAPPLVASPAPKVPVPPPVPAPLAPASEAPARPSAVPPAAAVAPTVTSSSPPGGPGVVIRILQDRPALALPNETLELRKEDLLVLPPEKAQLLVQARVAERVEVRPPTRST
ncbi:MAG: DNA replication complex GINS family protein [Euryarchaeota archaeon]|nr:DNA replication complex GINS family protein [Euryarchaeota archaeon]MDE1837149.1 DNA replication complex GINS family protein [Euryarchaeota archaeon]MDE1881445.1 DNA replication complex GINS family protein [Euryarchaeota archaeon]MDE2046326.1 DNA replication complex GINS family protein [Thermoplasmata archaeon]